jgi:hypothetical protein
MAVHAITCLLLVLPLAGSLLLQPRCPIRHACRHAAASALVMVASSQTATEAISEPDDDMDALIKREVLAAFAGLEESFAAGDDDKALELIQTQGKTVLASVLSRLEDEGQLLSSKLSARLEQLADEQTAEMLKKYEDRLSSLQVANEQARTELRNELQNLQTLSKEYDELMANKAGSFSRKTFVGGAAFLVGLSGVGAALNEGLKMALGAGGDVPTLAANGVLGIAGVLYYLKTKGS